MLRDVRRRLHEPGADLVLLNGGDLLWLLSQLPADVPRVLVAHNVEHRLFASQLQGLRAPASVLSVLKRDSENLRRYELDGFTRAGRVVFLSREDEGYARDRCPGLRTITLPPVFDGARADRHRRGSDERAVDVGMIANFTWWPNQRGLDWFSRCVLPKLVPTIRVHLFGHGSRRAAPKDPRAIAHGFVPRIQEAFSACDFMICPIRSGSGVSIKLAESIYHSVPVLATRFASRGLDVQSGGPIILLDEPEEWVGFLNEGSRKFAAQVVPDTDSANYHVQNHAPRMAQFLDGLSPP
jgi:glycosyltransferase involved in cell wall biosynthesis